MRVETVGLSEYDSPMRRIKTTLIFSLLLSSVIASPPAYSADLGPTVFSDSPQANQTYESTARTEFKFDISDPDGCCNIVSVFLYAEDGTKILQVLDAPRSTNPGRTATYYAIFDFANKYIGKFTLKAEAWDAQGNKSPLTSIGNINIKKADINAPQVSGNSNQSATSVKPGQSFTIDFTVWDDVGCCAATEVWLSTPNTNTTVAVGSAVALSTSDVTNSSYRATFTIPLTLAGGTYNIRMGATDFTGKSHGIESSMQQVWAHTFQGTIFVDVPAPPPAPTPTPTPTPTPVEEKKSTLPVPPGGYKSDPAIGIDCYLEKSDNSAFCINQRAAALTPAATPTPTPTATPTPTPTATPTPTPTATPTPAAIVEEKKSTLPVPAGGYKSELSLGIDCYLEKFDNYAFCINQRIAVISPTPSPSPTPAPIATPTPTPSPVATITPVPVTVDLSVDRAKLTKDLADVADLKKTLDAELLTITSLRTKAESQILENSQLKTKLDAELLGAVEDRVKAKAELLSVKALMEEAAAALASAKAESSAAEKAKQEAEAIKTAALKVITITCVNLKKSIWTITAMSPKCPAGYKKK
jgi:hypothetical protein